MRPRFKEAADEAEWDAAGGWEIEDEREAAWEEALDRRAEQFVAEEQERDNN